MAAGITLGRGAHNVRHSALCETDSLALPDYFLSFVFVVAEKGSGDIVSIEWCSNTSAL